MSGVFEPVETELNFPRDERKILEFWKQNRIFQKSLEARKGGPTFVFYEGPPTANGLPHNGSVLTRVLKDLFPRYKTMRGYYVPRKAGWDTHGLPVEVEVEKELRIHGKAAIEAYGVEPFVRRCIESVFRYTKEWEDLTDRVAFWCDLDDAYVTFHQSYVESVWWALSQLFKKGLLYQGHKVVWWWAQGGTALSAAEVGQGYKTVDDPSVFVAFKLVNEPDVSLLVWTTTPWTLPSNMYAAVHPNFEYAVVQAGDRKLIVASDLCEPLSKKLGIELTVLRTMKGSELAGTEYVPPFDLYSAKQKVVAMRSGEKLPAYWRVIAADFVLKDASGIVHVAPAFGEDDHVAHRKESARLANPEEVELLCSVNPDGTFTDDFERYAGRWVKDCDKDIQAELKQRGLLVHAEIYRHEYPFCWRADSDPLIQFARPAWYIRTTQLIDQAIENNRAIQWLPEHIKEGRFGDFLQNNVDWALSRERYWGTPLNIWINDESGNMEAPGSVAEIVAKNGHAFDHFYEARKADPTLSEHLAVHKPWIDHVTWQNPGESGTYRRVPEVIDCWFDSGCMPFAQWGFPHRGHGEFKQAFPADFISEGIDQTRGWFYSLLMISTLLFDEENQRALGLEPVRQFPYPFKTCIVLGHVCDKEGKKESKSKGNYTPPDVILDRVQMDFAVVEGAAQPGVALMGREDLEGLDVQEGAKLKLYPPGNEDAARTLELRVDKKLKRRVIVLHEGDRDALGLTVTTVKDVKPADVPRLAANERVTVEDTASSAPGADAFRWFFYASSPPWSQTRHSLANVRAIQKEFAVKLRNVYSFFVIYANIDGFNPHTSKGGEAARSELDRWILSELNDTVATVTRNMDGYDVYSATERLTSFVDALSNWYVRRSRDRFWKGGWDADKAGAYFTLHESLATLSRLIAPFVPYAAEAMYQNLVVHPAKDKPVDVPGVHDVPESVHLSNFPEVDEALIDSALSRKIAAVRDVVSLGLQVRTQHKLKVRQPLRQAHVILSNESLASALEASGDMIREELNVLALSFVPPDEARRFVDYKLKANFRTLGQKGLGKEAQVLKKVLGEQSAEAAFSLYRQLLAGVAVEISGVALELADVEVTFETKPGFAAAGGRIGVVALSTELDDELRDLGFAREFQNRIQTARKEMGLAYTDRISIQFAGSARAAGIIENHRTELAAEVLATDIRHNDAVPHDRVIELEGEELKLLVTRA